ncbi:MAG TPA: lysylphosphatidylglycerol synthase transmembrane domain-containing protein [Trebonia sp.]|nr:lysylphosphatidylglycerol synthase transmembrane domain-containing protein [Trebonia sp.]
MREDRPRSRIRIRVESALSRLIRVRSNPLTRLALLLIVLAFCGYGLAVEWSGVQTALGQMRWYAIAGSVAAAMAGSWAMVMAWRALLADLGSPLPALATIRISFVSQLGKYVPGAVWSFAGHVELGYDRGVPRLRGAASVVMALGVAIAVGLVIAAAGLPLASASAARHYLWLLATIPVLVACLCPPVLGWLTDRLLRLMRMQRLARRPTWRGLGVAVGWSVLGWLLQGLGVWVLLASVTGRGIHVLLLAVAGYALAFSASLVLVVFPGGIGPREVILIAALAPVLDRPAALALALVVRVATTISDLAWGGIGLLIGRTSGRDTLAAELAATGAAPVGSGVVLEPETQRLS